VNTSVGFYDRGAMARSAPSYLYALFSQQS
jgi:hypothetical protein